MQPFFFKADYPTTQFQIDSDKEFIGIIKSVILTNHISTDLTLTLNMIFKLSNLPT